tara:strand:+ start:232 stop:495 length:264 start_codon:yes stop_codon:yes gene_type:complete
MCFVVVRLDGCDLFGLVRSDRVRRLDVGRFVLIFDLLKCFGLGVLIICAMCCGPLVLQLHVQQLELEQHRLMQEIDGEDVRLPELRP